MESPSDDAAVSSLIVNSFFCQKLKMLSNQVNSYHTQHSNYNGKDVKDADRAAVKATIQQNKTSWSCTDLATAGSGNYVYAKGDITYPELHAGSYSGVFNLAVNLNYSAK